MLLYLFWREIYSTQNMNWGKACSMYEQTIYFNASYKPAYIKYARNYGQSNSSLAIGMLHKVASSTPASFIVYCKIGDIYYKNNQYDKAIQKYDQYMMGYYYLQNNKEKSREYWKKIVQLDPNSKIALDALNSL